MLNINSKDIESIYLLSFKEAKDLPLSVLSNGSFWWLRSKGDKRGLATMVDNVGYFYPYCFVDGICGVRPAIRIKGLKLNNIIRVGDTVDLLGMEAQYIGNNSILLRENISAHRFDAKSNEYEISEIKKYIEDWLEEKMKEEKDRIKRHDWVEVDKDGYITKECFDRMNKDIDNYNKGIVSDPIDFDVV